MANLACYNGIALEPRIASLFDRGLLAFLDDGSVLLSDLIPPEERDALRPTRRPAFLGHEADLIREHRETIFRRA